MKIDKFIKNLFTNSSDKNGEIKSIPSLKMPDRPFVTFYRIGPEFITDKYPVNNDFIKEAILDVNGIIGPKYYEQFDGVLEHLDNYDNDWLINNLSVDAMRQLKDDLLSLANNHNIPEAYTILGSLCDDFHQKLNYFKMAAEADVKEGMVAYGQHLLMESKFDKATEWITKGADLGDEIGLMIMGISYNFGTLTKIDYKRAAHYYSRLIKEHNNYFGYTNLGVMCVDANYFHTAQRLFDKAVSICDEELRKNLKFRGYADTLEDAENCRQLLSLPVGKRRMRVSIQYIDPKLEGIFIINNIVPPAFYDLAVESNPEPWAPDDTTEIDPLDIEEHNLFSASLQPSMPIIKYPHDDFIFPSIPVEIRNDNIFGNQHELVFLEKNVHLELNQYIQQRLPKLRAAFKRIGYQFTYLPSHTRSINDFDDLVGTYLNTYDPKDFLIATNTFHSKRDEYSYWNYLFSKEELPDDCAGFLRHTPHIEDIDRRPFYDYILFPYQPGTNWDKAFICFIDYLATLPFVKLNQKKRLPAGTALLIDESFNIFIVDGDGSPISEVKMPVLSKALYFLFLRHHNGFSIKCLYDHKDDLAAFYSKLSNRKDISRSINDITDPTKNSANEKISRIRHAFEEALNDYENAVDYFAPIGRRGEIYSVKLDRSRVIWRPTGISLLP